MKTEEVRHALRARHSDEGGWVYVEEAHRIDFLALACHGQWNDRRPARQAANAMYPWVGYEIKVSRSDFRAELRKPHKRAYAMQICNEFWFAAPDGLIKPSELPEGCGLLEVTAFGCRVVVPAPITAAADMQRLKVSQLMRHGIRPNVVRMAEEKIRDERIRRHWAEKREGELEAERDAIVELAGEILAPSVEVGSSWSQRPECSTWTEPEQVVVSEVGARSVRVESPDWSRSHRWTFGKLATRWRPTGSA